MITEQKIIDSISSKVIALIDSNVKSGRHSIESVLDSKFWGNITRKFIGIVYEFNLANKESNVSNKVGKIITNHICETYLHRDSAFAKEFLSDFALIKAVDDNIRVVDGDIDEINFTKAWLYSKGIYHHDFVVHLSGFIK